MMDLKISNKNMISKEMLNLKMRCTATISTIPQVLTNTTLSTEVPAWPRDESLELKRQLEHDFSNNFQKLNLVFFLK